MNFRRLSPGHWIAGVAALVLLLVMATDWYGTRLADELRRNEGLIDTRGPAAGNTGRALKFQIPSVAESMEQNAWQAFWTPGLDLIVLALLLASVALGLGAAYARAAGRTFKRSPSALAAVAGLLAILCVSFRLVEQPGLDELTTVRGGALLGLVALGFLVLGASRAMRAEQADPAPGEGDAAGPATTPAPAATGVATGPPR